MKQPVGYALDMPWRSAPHILFVLVFSSCVCDETSIHFQNFTINCDMWHLEDAVPIGQTLIVDMLEEPSPVSIAVERFSKK